MAYVYDAAPGDPSPLYEVEFMNAAGGTLAVVTLGDEDVQAVELQNLMLRVSERAA